MASMRRPSLSSDQDRLLMASRRAADAEMQVNRARSWPGHSERAHLAASMRRPSLSSDQDRLLMASRRAADAEMQVNRARSWPGHSERAHLAAAESSFQDSAELPPPSWRASCEAP